MASVYLNVNGSEAEAAKVVTSLMSRLKERGAQVAMDDPMKVAAGNDGGLEITLDDLADPEARAVVQSAIDQDPGAAEIITFR